MRNALVIFLVLLSSALSAQKTLKLVDASTLKTTEVLKLKTDSLVQLHLNHVKSKAQSKGFLAFSIDSLIYKVDTIEAIYFQGPNYSWGEIKLKHNGKAFNTKAWSNKRLIDKKASPEQLPHEIEKALDYYENHGRPFASIQLDSIQIIDHKIQGSVNLDLGPLIRIDSIIVKGADKFRASYIHNHIDIFPGDLYDESKIALIQSRLESLSILKTTKAPELIFTTQGASVFIYIQETEASSFNGILGIQPDADGNVIWTGDADLALRNAFHHGENFTLRWRRLQEQTQNLDVKAEYPYLFNTQIGVGGELSSYRRDSSFSSLGLQGALIYYISGRSSLSGFYEYYQSNNLSNNFSTTISSSDLKFNRYGLSLKLDETDNRISPKKGNYGVVKASLGNRDLKDPETELTEENLQYRLEATVIKHLSFYGKWNLKPELKAGIIYNDGTNYDNEAFRIGGLNSIRGMDEESIFADNYAVATLELHYYLERNSSVYAFVDQGWHERQRDSYEKDTPIGFGLGFNFKLNNGIFSLNYALGRQFENPIILRSGKVHFGFISVF